MAEPDKDTITTLLKVLDGTNAKLGKLAESALVTDGELIRYWPSVDPEIQTPAVQFLERYTDVVNYDTAASSVQDPKLFRGSRDGLWRNARVELALDRQESPFVQQTLREGFATMLYDDEARVVDDKRYKSSSKIIVLRWANIDPADASTILDDFNTRNLAAAAADPDAANRGGVGELTIKGNTYGSGYEIGLADLRWADDGSGIIDVVLVDTGASLEHTLLVEGSRTITLYYGYDITVAGISTFIANHSLSGVEQHVSKSFQLLRRKEATGLFDLMGVKVEYHDQIDNQYQYALGESTATVRHTRADSELAAPGAGDVTEGKTLIRTNRISGENSIHTTETTRLALLLDTDWVTVPSGGSTKYYRTVRHSTLAFLISTLGGLAATQIATVSASWNLDKSLNFTITTFQQGLTATQWEAGMAVDIKYDNDVYAKYIINEKLTSNDIVARNWVHWAGNVAEGGAARPDGYYLAGWHGPYRTDVTHLGHGKWLAVVVWGKP